MKWHKLTDKRPTLPERVKYQLIPCYDTYVKDVRVYEWNGQNFKMPGRRYIKTKQVSHWLEVTSPEEYW